MFKAVYVGMDDGNLRGYKGLPLLTDKRGPKLDNALYIYGVAFYLGKGERPHGLVFIDLNPRKGRKFEKQVYRKFVAKEIIKEIDYLKPIGIDACEYFRKGSLYYDHPEKKYLLQDLVERNILIEFNSKSGLVQKAHDCVTKLMFETGPYIDYKLKKLWGWSRSGMETVGSAQEFLSWNKEKIKNGMSITIDITQQLEVYIQNLYEVPIEPHKYLKINYESFIRTGQS